MFYGGELLDSTYEILKEIGTGGTGIVYLAYHTRLKKYVVVKKLKGTITDPQKVRVEVDILKGLHHPYLPQVYDFLEIQGQVYTVMDYVEGRDLQCFLDDGFVFREKELVRWMKQLCTVLEYLHNQQPPIYHSDIKPGNIMITADGDVCLIDFNISLGGEPGADILGLSPWYAAPEQYRKAQLCMEHQDSSFIVLDGKMDIYSLGATFYTLMTGLLPDREDPGFSPLSYLDLPYSDALVNIVEKTMEIEPRKRYPTAFALGKALDYIYKMDSGYRRIQHQNWALLAGCGTLVLTGILLCVYGGKTEDRQAYETAYERFLESTKEYEDDDGIKLGLNLLNDSKYRGILEKNPEDKGEILYSIGNLYFAQEDYKTAVEYYQEAIEEDSRPVYYRDLIISAVKAGETGFAQRMLEAAKREGLQDEELMLTEQEISYAKEEMVKVTEIAEMLVQSKNSEIAGYSSLLGAKAYGVLGYYEKQAKYLATAYELGRDKRCLRELGGAYLEAANTQGVIAKKEYLTKAESCYEKLQQSYAVSYRDQMNLAVIQENLGKYAQAESLLKELAEQYPEEYEIYMHLAYMNLKMEKETKAADYFKKASKYYEKAGSPGDSAMTELQDYMEQIGETP